VTQNVDCRAKVIADDKCCSFAIIGLSQFLSSAVNFGVILLRTVHIAIAGRLAAEMPLKTFFKVRHVLNKMYVLSFSRVKRAFWDSHLVELDAILLSVWFPAFGKVVTRWSSTVSGPKANWTAYRPAKP
jgi:hypothetical protein